MDGDGVSFLTGTLNLDNLTAPTISGENNNNEVPNDSGSPSSMNSLRKNAPAPIRATLMAAEATLPVPPNAVIPTTPANVWNWGSAINFPSVLNIFDCPTSINGSSAKPGKLGPNIALPPPTTTSLTKPIGTSITL